jgi:hypothetical protein
VDPAGAGTSDSLASDHLQVVGKRHDMIAVPTHSTAYVKEDFREELQHARDFVGDAFGGMVMACIEGQQLFSGDGVAEVKLV